MKVRKIAECENKMLSTVKSIIRTYEKNGRINKLLTFSAKKLIMEKRERQAQLLDQKVRKHIGKSPKIHIIFGDN